jgi:hypothetical protein
MVRFIFAIFLCVQISACLSCDGSDADEIIITGVLTPEYYPYLGFPLFQDSVSYHSTVVIAHYKGEYIDNASVEIYSDSQTVELAMIPKYYPFELKTIPFYQDTANVLTIIPGKRYGLRVTLADGRTFTATTRVPILPVISFPTADTTVELRALIGSSTNLSEKMRFIYATDPAASPIEFSANDASNFDFTVFSYSMTQTDSLAWVFKSDSEVLATVRIASLDSNFGLQAWRLHNGETFSSDSLYSEYYSDAPSMPLKKISNIEGKGGIGVFGSYSISQVTFTVKRLN